MPGVCESTCHIFIRYTFSEELELDIHFLKLLKINMLLDIKSAFISNLNGFMEESVTLYENST